MIGSLYLVFEKQFSRFSRNSFPVMRLNGDKCQLLVFGDKWCDIKYRKYNDKIEYRRKVAWSDS